MAMRKEQKNSVIQSAHINGNGNQINQTFIINQDNRTGILGRLFNKAPNNIPSSDSSSSPALGNSKILKPIRRSFRFERFSDTTALLDDLVFCDLQSFDEDVQREAISLYCWALYMLNEFARGLEFIAQLPEWAKELEITKVWRALITEEIQDSGGAELLRLLDECPNSGLLLYFCLMGPHEELKDKARERVAILIEENDPAIIKKLSNVLQYLTIAAINEADFTQAESYLELVQFDCDETYLTRMLPLLLALKRIEVEPEVECHGHVSVSQIRSLIEIKSELLDAISKAEADGFNFLDAKAMLVCVLTHLRRHKEALKVMSVEDLEKCSVDIIQTITGCYQEESDWPGMLDFIEKLSPEGSNQLNLVKAVALVNLGRDSEISDLEISDEWSAVLNDDGSVTLTDIDDLFLSIQLAKNRLSSPELCDDAKSYLIGLMDESLDVRYRFMLAEALSIAKLEEESFRVLDKLFQKFDPGIGAAQRAYIFMLLRRNKRKQVESIFRAIGEEVIFEYLEWTDIYIEFLASTQGLNSLAPKLEQAVAKYDRLGLKNRLIHTYLNLGENESKLQALFDQWGITQCEDIVESVGYLQLAVDYMPLDKLIHEMYRIYLRYGHRHVVQKGAAYFFFHPKLSGKYSPECPYMDEVTVPSAVVFDNNKSHVDEMFLIEAAFNDGAYSLAKRPSEIDAKSIIGKSKGDTVSIGNESKVIKEIIHPHIWMARHAIQNLSKFPRENGVWMLHHEVGDDPVDKLTEFLKPFEEEKGRRYKQAISGTLPMGCMLAGQYGNHIQAWLQFMLWEHEEYSYLPLNNFDSSVLNNKVLVLDPSAVCSLFVFTSAWQNIPPGSLKLVEALIDQVRDFDDEHMMHKIQDKSGIDELVRNAINYELAAIPETDPSATISELLNMIDPATRDSLIACFGHDERVFVSDDPWMRDLATACGLLSLSSFDVLRWAINNNFALGAQYINAVDGFKEISKGYFRPNQYPVAYVAHLLIEGDKEPNEPNVPLKNFVVDFDFTKENIANILLTITSVSESVIGKDRILELFDLFNATRSNLLKMITKVILTEAHMYESHKLVIAISDIAEAFGIPITMPSGPCSPTYALQVVTQKLYDYVRQNC